VVTPLLSAPRSQANTVARTAAAVCALALVAAVCAYVAVGGGGGGGGGIPTDAISRRLLVQDEAGLGYIGSGSCHFALMSPPFVLTPNPFALTRHATLHCHATPICTWRITYTGLAHHFAPVNLHRNVRHNAGKCVTQYQKTVSPETLWRLCEVERIHHV
jgi:hypothetical protein